MALIIKSHTHAPGATIYASETNTNLDTLYTEINGNLDNANIKDGANISDSKLDTITTAGKVGGDAELSILSNAYPIGSIYFNATDSTNPATLLGFGTWSSFGAGRVLVGYDSSDTDFDTAEETGGSKTHTLTVDEIPSHSHDLAVNDDTPGAVSRMVDSNHSASKTQTLTGGTNAVNVAGGGSAHNNVQPYITVYIWKRTA